MLIEQVKTIMSLQNKQITFVNTLEIEITKKLDFENAKITNNSFNFYIIYTLETKAMITALKPRRK